MRAQTSALFEESILALEAETLEGEPWAILHTNCTLSVLHFSASHQWRGIMPEDFNFKQIAEDTVAGATAAATLSEQYNTIMGRSGAERNVTANPQTPNEVLVPSFTDLPQGSAKSGSSTSDKATNAPEDSTAGKPTVADKAVCSVGSAAFGVWAVEAAKARSFWEVGIAAGLGITYSAYLCRNEFVDMGKSIKNYVTGSDSKK